MDGGRKNEKGEEERREEEEREDGPSSDAAGKKGMRTQEGRMREDQGAGLAVVLEPSLGPS